MVFNPIGHGFLQLFSFNPFIEARYCMGPGFFIKRCENFDEDSCNSVGT